MNKKTLILGGILIILIALAYTYQGPLKKWQASLGQPSNFLAVVDVEQISKMEITQNGQVTILEKQDGKWKVGGTKDFYVKDSVADNAIQGLEEAVKSELELVSANKDKKGGFQTDESGIAVKLYQGEETTADFVIGKTAGNYRSTYISRPESNNTYSVKANLFSAFNRPEWRDRDIFSTNKEAIAKIRFQYPRREFTVEKTEDSWSGVSPYKFDVDGQKIDKILEIMSSLTAVKIPTQSFKGTGLDKYNIIIQATGEGVDNTIMVGNQTSEKLYFVKKGDSDNIYFGIINIPNSKFT